MTPAPPAFTVIVPCFNGAATLDDALASARAQTAGDLEILVVDDGSTDRSAAIAARHADEDPRVRVIHQANRGVGAARNTALRVARGRYVSFLDADDVLEPGKLARQGHVLDAEPEIGLVVCDGCVIDAGGRVTWPTLVDVRRFAGHPSLLSVCLQGGPFPPVVPLLRTTLVRQVGGFDEDRRAGGWADIDLWMRLAITGVDYHVLADRLVRYRSTATNMSADTVAMDAAADLVYANLFRNHPGLAAQALRMVQRRLRDLEAARDDLRAVTTKLLNDAATADAVPLLLAPPAPVIDRRPDDVAALMHALARQGAGDLRPIWIWGAGAAGREALARLAVAGGTVDAFIDSDPAKAGTRCADVIVNAPADLVRASIRPYVLVASMYADAITQTLDALGWRRAVDYYVVGSEAVLPVPAVTETAA